MQTRFREVHEERNRMIYAVDFDGTLCKSIWPEIGEPNEPLIKALIEKRESGHKLILWTCREGQRLYEAVRWCHLQGLDFDTVNENIKESVEKYGADSRKVHADVYIDDKSKDPIYALQLHELEKIMGGNKSGGI